MQPRSESNFRDLLIAASLKHYIRRPGIVRVASFRDLLIAASLKPPRDGIKFGQFFGPSAIY